MFLLLLFYVAVPCIQVYFLLSERTIVTIGDVLNFTASVTVLHWFLANIIFSSKVAFFQSVIPYDRRIRIHMLSSAAMLLFLIYHVLYKILLGKYIDPVSWALLSLLSLFFIAALMWIPIPGAHFLSKFASRFSWLYYDRYKLAHRYIVFALFILIFIHIGQADYLGKIPVLSSMIFGALFLLAFLLQFVGHFGLNRVQCKVVQTIRTGNVLQLYVQPKRKFHYKCGQFAFLYAKGIRGKEEHPFSFLSAPHEEVLIFGIRLVGDFTRALGELTEGTTIQIRGGFGSFYPHDAKPICMISSGIGVVPCISILKDLYQHKDSRHIQFFISVNNSDEIPELNSIQKIALEMPNLRLKILVYTQDGLFYSSDLFRQEIDNPKSYHFYVCSSPFVRSKVIAALVDNGVSPKAISFEAFSFR